MLRSMNGYGNRIAVELSKDIAALSGIEPEVMMIGPHNVDDFLAMNTKNYRKLNQKRVRQLVSDINGGRWSFQSDGIGVTVDKVITNGQHRLTAIKESGATVPVLVVWNMPRGAELDPNTDCQKPRGASTHLSAIGCTNPYQIAATIRAIYNLLLSGVDGFPAVATNSCLMAINEAFPDIAESVRTVSGCQKYMGVTPVSVWFYICQKCDGPEFVSEQLDILLRKKEASSLHPMNVCREFLGKVVGGRKDATATALKALFHCYQASLDGREMKMIRTPESIRMPSSVAVFRNELKKAVSQSE